jgi:hypothetical protein
LNAEKAVSNTQKEENRTSIPDILLSEQNVLWVNRLHLSEFSGGVSALLDNELTVLVDSLSVFVDKIAVLVSQLGLLLLLLAEGLPTAVVSTVTFRVSRDARLPVCPFILVFN